MRQQDPVPVRLRGAAGVGQTVQQLQQSDSDEEVTGDGCVSVGDEFSAGGSDFTVDRCQQFVGNRALKRLCAPFILVTLALRDFEITGGDDRLRPARTKSQKKETITLTLTRRIDLDRLSSQCDFILVVAPPPTSPDNRIEIDAIGNIWGAILGEAIPSDYGDLRSWVQGETPAKIYLMHSCFKK